MYIHWMDGVERKFGSRRGVRHGSKHWEVSGVTKVLKVHARSGWMNAAQTGLQVYSFETADLELLIARLSQFGNAVHHNHKKTSRLISKVLTGYLLAR
jgi:hypothetical protein